MPEPPRPADELAALVFADPRRRDAMLLDVLDTLRRRGATDLDGVRRAVLGVDDLARLLPPRQAREQSGAMVEALVAYLDGAWDAGVFAEALERWRSSLEAARQALRWDDVPPIVWRLATLYADALLAYAHDTGWVRRQVVEERELWELTVEGGEAMRRLRRELGDAGRS